MTRPIALFNGSRTYPVLTLSFAYEAVAPDGTLLREWVTSLPERVWRSESRTWESTGTGPDPDGNLERLGFAVIGPHDELDTVNAYVSPYVTFDETYQMYAVHPRLGGVDAALPGLPVSAVWRASEHRWLVPPTDVPDGPYSREGFAEYAPGVTPFHLVTRRPIPVETTVAAAPGTGELDFDGSIDGLRAVPVTDLLSVDPATASSMEAVGITTVHDLLHHVPNRYIDLSNPVLASSENVGEKVAIIGRVSSAKTTKTRKGTTMTTINFVDDGESVICAKFFGAAWMARKYPTGTRAIMLGKLEQWRSGSGFVGYSMNGPVMDRIGDVVDVPVIGVYPQSGKNDLSTWQIHRAVREAVRRMGPLVETVPEPLLRQRGLVDRTTAFHDIHLPANLAEARASRDRLAYDELLRLQLTLQVERARATSPNGIEHRSDGHLTRALVASLPYPLTGAQQRVAREIAADMDSDRPMHRLLQGDVGSGKTVTSLIALLHGVQAGSQGALMAPTEILASQHYEDMAASLEGLTHPDGRPVQVALLLSRRVESSPRLPDLPTERKSSAGKPPAHRRAVMAGLADGSIDIVVGTHALIAKDVAFHRLGIAVIDEQHRFGVEQRQALAAKAPDGFAPDMLAATATPVPRTAIMSVFGDLDVSTLDEMPPGRSPIVTGSTDTCDVGDPQDKTWRIVRSQVSRGRQAFVVVPLVADSEAKTAAGASTLREQLAAGALKGLRIGLAHGKQSPDERSAQMAAFAAGELDVLVATTVIEVGVNVPNATVMVVMRAHDLGLAQLHQIRGRVGRGSHRGACILVHDPELTPVGRQRIDAMVASTDGAYLAEVDLRLRGWGTLLGGSQSGPARDLRVADLFEDTVLMEAAQQDARELVAADPHLDRRPGLRDEILRALGTDAGTWLVSA